MIVYLELESDFEEISRFELVEDWLLVLSERLELVLSERLKLDLSERLKLVLSERLPTIFSEVRWLVSPSRLVLCL